MADPKARLVYCKDCLHMVEENYDTYCTCPEMINLVSGKPSENKCSQERSKKGSCGPEGRFFEPAS